MLSDWSSVLGPPCAWAVASARLLANAAGLQGGNPGAAASAHGGVALADAHGHMPHAHGGLRGGHHGNHGAEAGGRFLLMCCLFFEAVRTQGLSNPPWTSAAL